MFCPQCRSPIQDGNRFCANCGASVDGVVRNPFASPIYPNYPAGSFRNLYGGWVFTAIFVVIWSVVSDWTDMVQGADPSESIVLLMGVLALVGLGFIVVSCIYWAYLLYRCWAIIQDARQGGERIDTTPGRAVGFNFIPLFQCYWAFVAQLGLTRCLNAYCKKRDIPVQPVRVGLAIASSVMCTVFYLFIPCSVVLTWPHASMGLKLACFLLSATAYIVNFVFDFYLYRQFADTAEAIQRFKNMNVNAAQRQ